MIPSAAIISIIVKALRSAGVRDAEILEEMVDHYLIVIENEVANGATEAEAIQHTINQIQTTNLSNLTVNKTKKWPFLLFTLMFLTGGYSYLYQPFPAKKPLAIAELTTKVQSPPKGWPIAEPKAEISSHFGLRKHPVTGAKNYHRGIDIKAPIGTPVLATGDATVKKVGYNQKAGRFIILQHDDRYTTKYFHLSAISISEGDTVHKGDTIGVSGNSGMSSAPHLHYEIIDQDAAIDPIECIGV